MDWKNKDEGTITVETEQDIKDGEKVVGKSFNKQVVETDITALEQGVRTYEVRIGKNVEKLEEINAQLDAVGKIPRETKELLTLAKNMMDLAIIEKAKGLKDQMPSIEEEIKNDNQFLTQRKELLATRPTEDKMGEEETKKEEEAEEPKEEEKKEGD